MAWIIGIVAIWGVCILIEMPQRNRMKNAYKMPHFRSGSSRFAAERDLRKAGLFKRRGIRIGYGPNGRPLYYPGAGHLLTVAAARMGKGATLIINALLSWKGSCVVICPKAENTAVTGHFRRRFGPVWVLNPFGMFPEALKGLTIARFNPMDILDTASAEFHALCDKVAAALVWDEGEHGRHFTNSARVLVSGIIAALMRHGLASEKNLVAVARIVSGDVIEFCRLVTQTTNDPFIIQKLSRFCKAGVEKSDEVRDVIATAISQLAFIGNAAIAESLMGSDFRFRDLRRMVATIYICLPLHMLDVCDKYFRLIFETFLMDMLSESQNGPGNRVLAIVDEMAQMGAHMKSLENAMGMAAGAAGLQLWCILQDLSQLIGMFPKTWETFIQNCGATLWFGGRDHTTREYVSKLAGTQDVTNISRSVYVDPQTGEPRVTDSGSQQTVPLIAPHQVGQLSPDEMIAFVDGVSCGPIKAKRKFYFRCAEFRGKYRPNPYFGKR